MNNHITINHSVINLVVPVGGYSMVEKLFWKDLKLKVFGGWVDIYQIIFL